MGTPAVAVGPLVALVEAGYEVPLVISGPDKRRGRGGQMTASPVKAAAVELGLTVSADLDDVGEVDADLGVVVAFGRLIPRSILDELPMVNIHFSLLPRWRGAAPVERAVLAGDDETGVCLMVVDRSLDTGDVYRRDAVTIGSDETVEELRARLLEMGTTQLLDALGQGLGVPEPQRGEPTYAAKVAAHELELDWSSPAEELHRLVRVGGAWTTFRGKRLKIHGASLVASGLGTEGAELPRLEPGRLVGSVVGTGSGPLELLEVQPEGRSSSLASDWLNGARPSDDDTLGT